jgi:hypothetical protein
MHNKYLPFNKLDYVCTFTLEIWNVNRVAFFSQLGYVFHFPLF